MIGSGFGGSVAALRLAEKGYRVCVLERGRRYEDGDLPRSAWDLRRFIWAPSVGLRGVMRNAPFKHVFSSSQTGVGGGSLVYGGVLFRPQPAFYTDPQWQGLSDWERRLAPHYSEAERMLGARPVPFDSIALRLTREIGDRFDAAETFERAPVGVFFGEAGRTVPDPYFGGDGPERTGCIRCGSCLVGCRFGAANTLMKNYLWFAERRGVEILPEREAIDVAPLGSPDGSDGYRVTSRRPGAGLGRDQRVLTTGGVVFAGGAVGTNTLLSQCKLRGSLPQISDRLGRLVRTNSEAVLAVTFPRDIGSWEDVAASSRVIVDGDNQIEFLTYGRDADMMGAFFTLIAGSERRTERLLKWLGNVARRPRRALSSLRVRGWSRRSLMMLVMQPRDNAISFTARKRWTGGYKMKSEADPERPTPTFIDTGHRVAAWVAARTGGVAQSSVFEVFGDRPMTAHVVGGAVIGETAAEGVVDGDLAVFGYENLLVTDAAALPANPGVNPALTITALAEHALVQVPAADAR